MNAIADFIETLDIGEPSAVENLKVVPLVMKKVFKPDYLTLDEALEKDYVVITEVSESGDVPELRLENRGPKPVFLMDGEELVGAKQNRILNISIFAPPKATITVPVSCVEAGRWSYRGREFKSEGRVHYASGRAAKMAQVSESLHCAEKPCSDQSAIWHDIRTKASRMQADSPTEAMSGMFSRKSRELDEFLEGITPLKGQSGAAFAINGRLKGIEVFDSPATLEKLLPKLVGSYALDAIDVGPRPGPVDIADTLARFLANVSRARQERYETTGEGETVRLRGRGIAGGALLARERVVHLSAFRAAGAPPRMRPASSRAARYWRGRDGDE